MPAALAVRRGCVLCVGAVRPGRLLAVAVLAARIAAADGLPSVTLPEQAGPHWFWLSDIILHRTALFDGDSGGLLGTITSGSPGVGFVISPLFARDRPEIYLAETYFSRGVRGERTDVLTVYDRRTLAPLAEIPLPAKRAEYFPGNAANALSDDGRYVGVFNLTPVTSLSVVDVQERRLVGEVPTPGCSLVYAAGPRRFLMLCANGAALTVTLDEAGGEPRVERTAPFFDPQKDPLTEKAVRRGDEWLFVSFDGFVQPVDVSGAQLRFGERWPLLDDADRKASWRIGGPQHLAVHARSGRLYTLMHQGSVDTHKESGTEVWVYDLAQHARVQRIALGNPVASFVRLQAAASGNARVGRVAAWLMEKAFPSPGIERILVTQDEKPILVTSASLPPTLTVHDALTGDLLREVPEPGLASSLLFAP
jgi:methylamine dehydrogenase heavy chain